MMSNYRTSGLTGVLVVVVTAVVTLSAVAAETSVGTAFTYQGQLKNSGVPFTGDAAFTFTLWDAATDGRQVTEPLLIRTTVENGLFQVELDFGAAPFQAAQALWLEVAVETAYGSGRLQPRQSITPAPFALYALNAPSTGGTGLTLPYDGSTASTDIGFSVLQSGDAGSGAFSIANPSNTQPALTLVTLGSGPGLLSTSNSGPAVWGRTGVGGGNAGYFETAGTDNTQAALAAENKAAGPAAYFRTTNSANTNPALVAESKSDGSAAQFVTMLDLNNANLEPTLTSTNDSFGSAGGFVLTNADNTSDALTGRTIGPGDAVVGFTSGAGRAGVFEVDNIAVRANPALEATTNARGGGAGLFRTTNGLNTTAALTAETSGNNTAMFGRAQGLGDALYGYNAFGGNAVHGLVEGRSGKAGTFQIREPANADPAVEGITSGTGAAGYFENTSGTGAPKALHAKSNSSQGWAGYFQGRGYFSGALAIGTLEPRAVFEIADPRSGAPLIKAGNALVLDAAGASVGGWVEATQYKFHTPKTRYYALDPADFDLQRNDDYNLLGGSVLGMGASEGSTSIMFAPVHLPHGAFVTNFRCFWYSSGTQPISFELVQLNLKTGTYTVMGYVDSAATSGGYQDQNTSEILSGTIDNRSFAYHVRVESWCPGGTFGPDGWCQGVEIMGASITYTITEAN